MAGRGIDGRLWGKELKWVPGIRCHGYAWSAEFPKTELYSPARPTAKNAR